MNIFILNENPELAARDYCNKHLPKMCVEMLQMLGIAVIRHGATPDMMPLAKATQKPIKGGYHNHPCTIWVGDSKDNFRWASRHGLELCLEYTRKYGKIHYCENGIRMLSDLRHLIDEELNGKSNLSPFALAMPDEYRPEARDRDTFEKITHARAEEAIQAYRRYYHSKEFAKWDGRRVPHWWMGDAQ